MLVFFQIAIVTAYTVNELNLELVAVNSTTSRFKYTFEDVSLMHNISKCESNYIDKENSENHIQVPSKLSMIFIIKENWFLNC